MRTTISAADIFSVFMATAKPMAVSRSGLSAASSNWAIAPRTMPRMACSRAVTSASRRAPGGWVPGRLRASARTKAPARATASVAMPSHALLHRMWVTGSMVWAEMSA